jgi:uncharacterized protein HemX
MNPGGPIEEAGQTARSAVLALSSAPIVLALVLLIGMILGVTAFLSHERTVAHASQVKALAEQCDTHIENNGKLIENLIKRIEDRGSSR